MKKNLIIATLLFVAFGSTFAMTIEAYGLYGLDYSKTGKHADTFKEKSWGGGVSFSNVDPDEFFGVFSSINILYTTEIKVSDTWTKIEYDKPLSLDTLLGIRLNPKVLFISFPIDIGLHVATDWKSSYTALRLGIGGNLGAKLNFGKFGIFARAQLSYDFIQWNFKDSGTKNSKPKHFSLMPQVGLSFSF